MIIEAHVYLKKRTRKNGSALTLDYYCTGAKIPNNWEPIMLIYILYTVNVVLAISDYA